MSRTEIDGDQVLDGSIQKKDIDISTVGQALITKLIAGQGVTIVNNSGADQGTGEVEIKSGSGDFGGNFASYFDFTSQSTTSNNWVEVFEEQIPIGISGDVIVFYTAELGQTLKSKAMGLLIEARLASNPYEVVVDIRDGIVINAEFQLRTGFFIVRDVGNLDTIDIRMSYGQTDDGGTASIQNVGFVSWRV
jgi:hypothetical protein